MTNPRMLPGERPIKSLGRSIPRTFPTDRLRSPMMAEDTQLLALKEKRQKAIGRTVRFLVYGTEQPGKELSKKAAVFWSVDETFADAVLTSVAGHAIKKELTYDPLTDPLFQDRWNSMDQKVEGIIRAAEQPMPRLQIVPNDIIGGAHGK